MTDFDPTTIQTPFGMLTPDEKRALILWPHGWQVSGGDGYWVDMRHHPTWAIGLTYRGKPAPAKVAYEDEAALYDVKRIYTHAEVQHLLDNRPTWEEWEEIIAAGYKQKARADRLEAALRKIGSITVHSGGSIHGVNARQWGAALRQAREVAHAALKGGEQQ